MPSKSTDASLLNTLMPEHVQTRQHSPAGLTSRALHLASTLQNSEYFLLLESKAAVGAGEHSAELQQRCAAGTETGREASCQAPALGSLIPQK